MVKIADPQTTNRVTDAALVLLDAAREASKEAPDYRPGDPNASTTLAMAVQALIIADHMPAGGASSERLPVPPEFAHRWRGVAAGLGISIGLVSDPVAQMLVLNMCASEMGKHSQAVRPAGDRKS